MRSPDRLRTATGGAEDPMPPRPVVPTSTQKSGLRSSMTQSGIGPYGQAVESCATSFEHPDRDAGPGRGVGLTMVG